MKAMFSEDKSMGKVFTLKRIDWFMREPTNMEKSMVRARSILVVEIPMKETLSMA